MPSLHHGIAAFLLALIISGVSVYAVFIYTEPPRTSQVNIEVSNNGGFLQNLTVSCYGCVPIGKYVWQGIVTIGNDSFEITQTKPNSTAIEISFAEEIPNPTNLSCSSGLETNSSCVYILGPLPFSISFDIQKTSTGGYLRAILYLTNGNYFPFETTSGNLTQTFKFQSVRN